MKQKITAFLISFLLYFTITACFWDTDTIEMERQQFPSVIELISGKFLRHSPEYHYWRIKDREHKLSSHPDSLSLYDDLAVSYSKIGDNEKAIETILKKDKLQPGRYETYANLGTFYIHNGDLQKGIESIDKAIEINPEAHFGREVYQRYVAEYVLKRVKNGKLTFPISPDYASHRRPYREARGLNNFFTFLDAKLHGHLSKTTDYYSHNTSKEELEQAVIGVLGMMKFGNHDSPVLLEILGDLLLNWGNKRSGARNLAARAYLKCAYEVEDSSIREAYVKRVVQVINLQVNKRGAEFDYTDLEKVFKNELAEGEAFYQQIRTDEIQWITSNENPETAFALKYYVEPTVSIRKQPGNGKNKSLEARYTRNRRIKGVKVDFRPTLLMEKTLSEKQKDVVDSSYKRYLGEQITPETETPESDNNLLGILLGLIGFAGWIYWRSRKRGLLKS